VVKIEAFLRVIPNLTPIPVAVRSEAEVWRRPLAGIVSSNPEGALGGGLSLVSVVFCQVEVSATGRSLVQRSPTECGVSECDREASIMRRPWPTGGCCATGGIPNLIRRFRSRASVVGIVTTLWGGGSWTRIAAAERFFFALSRTSRPALGPTQHSTQWVAGFLSGVSQSP
jgi:hypothetical protein